VFRGGGGNDALTGDGQANTLDHPFEPVPFGAFPDDPAAPPLRVNAREKMKTYAGCSRMTRTTDRCPS
jgi:hypothetical protein